MSKSSRPVDIVNELKADVSEHVEVLLEHARPLFYMAVSGEMETIDGIKDVWCFFRD
jgi:hypothetical protein